MTSVDNEENQNFDRLQTKIPMNTPKPMPKKYHTKIPTCMVCSVEEVVMRSENNLRKKGNRYSRRKAHLAIFFISSLQHHFPYMLFRGFKK